MSSPDAPAHAGEALGRGDPALALAALPGGPPAGFVSQPFWLFWFFENISVAGRWMMEIAGGWLVARLADSAAQVASLISIASIPVLVSMAWAGQVADRYDRRRTVLLMGPGLAVTAPRWAGMRLVCAPLVVGLAQVGLSYSTSPLGAAVMLAISSFGIATLAGLTLMFIQLTCPQDLQGRLLGLHNILFAVVPPAGIVMGMLTHYVELRVSMRFFGLLFAGVSTAWLLLARIGSADLTRAEGNGVV
ncbi:MFS transporter [Myxococcus xanthus]|uniref:MFS transporter n=1 Tax=Myxococcus xanthus TaxID=34 RepID=UPI001CEC83D1|nr:MFS transporter [Myxococcus xanthus]UYI11838.1 MFS transporter [Myxococcus xanthus]UYI19207.1 MFS transporter [Myxococcus xanthus]